MTVDMEKELKKANEWWAQLEGLQKILAFHDTTDPSRRR